MSFGTTFRKSRQATIQASVAEIQKAHPDTKVITAFTSHIIIDRIQKREGIRIPTPEEALQQLKAAGYTRVALTSLDVIPGMKLGDKWDFVPGVRMDHHNMFGTHWTPKAALNYQADSKTQVYASWGRVFKAPTADDLYYNNVGSMISAFSVFNLESGQSAAITGGVGEALIATAMGLCVAILSLLVHGPDDQ